MQVIAEAIGHDYGPLPVLENVDLAVREGEVLAIIGPSGCGKSTLLSILGGLLQPSRGRVLLKGQPQADCLNPLTFVFQDFALLPWRSVAGNVELVLEHHRLGSAERRRRVADALARTGLSDFAAALPKQLSGGMRQRVGIARALAVRPAVLLLDEPLSALDAQTRELLLEDFESLWVRERTTAIYVTHNLSEALRLADRVAVFSRRPGRLKELVEIPLPRGQRSGAQAQVELAALHDRLWGLIRAEAQSAVTELEHG
ncbi:ABC transporter ATP-binding protein [Aquibaculum arenosum]|uniref:ABC transporter ATP-binding protein n=1 Tax=Aquibaculum arenosum TaxID=3032591 RepID=A0ABT5YHG2_9PROT|nr:ABC transporter ATP-binding protein [Fodinicurvata sp. CAU 1616]MDF2094371.1 ABC transporter ATP-binding protein [Fodinicurvata sp. CAU 1616]